MLLLALSLLAAASEASAAPSPTPARLAAAPLREEAQVGDLCDALRDLGDESDADPAQAAASRRAAHARHEEAAQEIYAVEIPSKGFAFGRFRPGEDLVELDGDRPLRAIDGVLSLDLDGTDEVAFPARPEQVSAWSKAKLAGTLKLVVLFRPDGERCAGSKAAHAWRLSGHSLSWQIEEGGKIRAAADEEGEPLGPPPGTRSMRIERVSLDDADDATVRLTGVQARLDRCAAGAVRLGNLVVTFAVQAGHVRDPQVIMDALRDEVISACVARALSGAVLTGAAGASGRGTVTLALQ